MSKIIAFSGGCCSGKTTTLQALAKELEAHGRKVVILHENIRVFIDALGLKSIDEARENPETYLRIQNKAIREKIYKAEVALKDKSDTIYLEDRFLSDSLFYLKNYIDKTKLSGRLLRSFKNLQHDVIVKLYNFSTNYYRILDFYPLKTDELSKYRPINLHETKYVEYEGIRGINSRFIPYHKLTSIDLNETSIENVINDIMLLL